MCSLHQFFSPMPDQHFHCSKWKNIKQNHFRDLKIIPTPSHHHGSENGMIWRHMCFLKTSQISTNQLELGTTFWVPWELAEKISQVSITASLHCRSSAAIFLRHVSEEQRWCSVKNGSSVYEGISILLIQSKYDWGVQSHSHSWYWSSAAIQKASGSHFTCFG